MRIEDTFMVARPPEDVFAFMVEPENLPRWQTIKTYVTPLTDGPPRLGYRVREGSKVGPRRWDQVVEFTEFDPGRVLGVKVVEGPVSSGRWTLTPAGGGARVHFEGDVTMPRLPAPLLKPLTQRQFRGFPANLRRALEGG